MVLLGLLMVSPKRTQFSTYFVILTSFPFSLTFHNELEVYNARHPPKQFAWDHTKKTVAILGSGWAATSILKDIDTENYNVVCIW